MKAQNTLWLVRKWQVQARTFDERHGQTGLLARNLADNENVVTLETDTGVDSDVFAAAVRRFDFQTNIVDQKLKLATMKIHDQ